MAAIKVHIITALEPPKPKDEDALESTFTENSQQDERRERVFGLHEGMGWMSDDFDDELPDSFWLGEDD